MPSMMIYLNDELYDLVRKTARENDGNESKIIQEALKKYFEEKNG